MLGTFSHTTPWPSTNRKPPNGTNRKLDQLFVIFTSVSIIQILYISPQKREENLRRWWQQISWRKKGKTCIVAIHISLTQDSFFGHNKLANVSLSKTRPIPITRWQGYKRRPHFSDQKKRERTSFARIVHFSLIAQDHQKNRPWWPIVLRHSLIPCRGTPHLDEIDWREGRLPSIPIGVCQFIL